MVKFGLWIHTKRKLGYECTYLMLFRLSNVKFCAMRVGFMLSERCVVLLINNLNQCGRWMCSLSFLRLLSIITSWLKYISVHHTPNSAFLITAVEQKKTKKTDSAIVHLREKVKHMPMGHTLYAAAAVFLFIVAPRGIN